MKNLPMSNEQKELEQTINFIRQNDKLNCTQYSKDSRVFFIFIFDEKILIFPNYHLLTY